MTTPTKENLLKSSLYGVGREFVIQPLLFPMEVIKVRQQCSQKDASKIALEMFRDEGFQAFYKGFSSQMGKIVIKPIWRWPMMTEIPKSLHPLGLGPCGEQVITGLTIATVDALVLTPLEKMKIQSALQGRHITFREIYKEGWKGSSFYWVKLSVNWGSFLVAQNYLKDRNKPNYSLTELSIIGLKVAIIVSIVSAPFDYANTMMQSSHKKVSFSYRGWPLSAASLIVHNVTSVIFLHHLSSKFD